VCVYTGKVKFFYSDAEIAARNLRRRNETNHAEYRCSACLHFHVGSSLETRGRS